MDITRVNHSSTTGNTGSFSFDAGASDLVVAIVYKEGGGTISSPAWAGVAMTQLYTATLPSTNNVYCYAITNGATGTNNFTFSISGGASIVIVSYTGARAYGFPDATVSISPGSLSGTQTCTLSTVADNCFQILGFFSADGVGSVTAGSGSTYVNGAGGVALFDSNAQLTPSGSKSMSVSLGATLRASAFSFSFAPPGIFFGNSLVDHDQASGTVSYTNDGDFLSVSVNSTSNNVTAMTYNGIAMTQLGSAEYFSTYARYHSTWYLVNPSIGTYNIVTTGGANWQFDIFSATGVSQIAPISGHTTVNTSGANAYIDVTTTVSGAHAVGVGQIGAASTAGTDTTMLVNGTPGNFYALRSTNSVASPGTFRVQSSHAGSVGYFLRGFGINPATTSELTSNLVAYYTFDSDQTTDADGGTYNLTKTGTVNSATGKISNGCDFTARSTSNYLSRADDAALDPSNITVQAWVNLSTISFDQGIVTKWWDGTQRSWGLSFEPSAWGFYFDCANSGSNTDHIARNTITGLSTGVWYHVVGTYDGTTVKLYTNGVLGATTAGLSGGLSGNAVQMAIGVDGRATPSQALGGYIDEVAIWSRALSSAEVTSLYNSGSGLQYPFVDQPSTDNTFQILRGKGIRVF